jgi:hypothetical protein
MYGTLLLEFINQVWHQITNYNQIGIQTLPLRKTAEYDTPFQCGHKIGYGLGSATNGTNNVFLKFLPRSESGFSGVPGWRSTLESR